jgi:hypothetical protein
MAFTDERWTNVPEPALSPQRRVAFATIRGEPAPFICHAQPLPALNVLREGASGDNGIVSSVRLPQPAIVSEFFCFAIRMLLMPQLYFGKCAAGDQP